MAKRSAKPRDLNALAARIVGEATDESAPTGATHSTAAERGRLGGLKGGKARAARLTPEQRSEAARKAARARWKRS